MAIRDNSVHGGIGRPLGVALASGGEQADIAPRMRSFAQVSSERLWGRTYGAIAALF
jgi:hypothetical protein